MGTRIQNGLTKIGRGVIQLPRLILTLPVMLLRLIFRLPTMLWRGLVGFSRFLVALPGRLWRGFVGLLHFLVALPGRLWRGFVGSLRFLVALPSRLWRGFVNGIQFVASIPSRIADGLRRTRERLVLRVRAFWLRLREWRARFVFWVRSSIIRPRTLQPRAQGLVVVAIATSLTLLAFFGSQLRRASRHTEKAVVVTATPKTPSITTGGSTTPLPNPSAASVNATSLPSLGNPIGGGGVVAFSLRQNGNTDIFARKLDDDQLLRLTYHLAEDREPVWAPDGETMGFISHRGKNWDIYRLDLVSGVLIRLTRDPHYDGHPSWSPDGAFVTFESYRSGNLDIYIMAADGSQVQQLTANQAADFAPTWSPDGRHIAFVSYRQGSKDVMLYPLDAGSESAVINLTQTPDRDEDAPTWSPDGSRLAFSVGRFGAQTIYITTFDWNNKYLDEAQTQLFNPGARPDWSPDGTSLIYEYQRADSAYLIADHVSGWGAGSEVFSTDAQMQNPSWSAPMVDPLPFAEQRQTAPMGAASLYLEEILPIPENGPPYTIVALKDVNGGDDREFLSDRVNDSFAALRGRVLQETGIDYLSSIGDSFRAIGVEPPPGQSPRSWHKAGRAFDLNQGLLEREEQLVELVREDIGFRTYWRVFLRVERQDGSLGEPLCQAPWDLKVRQAGGLAAREGGELKQEVPLGYYVDFTELASDYGWERVPASNRWRHQWADTNWWLFQKTQGLSWLEAMLELYRSDQIEAVFGPLAEEQQ
jgi:TolB protein